MGATKAAPCDYWAHVQLQKPAHENETEASTCQNKRKPASSNKEPEQLKTKSSRGSESNTFGVWKWKSLSHFLLFESP